MLLHSKTIIYPVRFHQVKLVHFILVKISVHVYSFLPRFGGEGSFLYRTSYNDKGLHRVLNTYFCGSERRKILGIYFPARSAGKSYLFMGRKIWLKIFVWQLRGLRSPTFVSLCTTKIGNYITFDLRLCRFWNRIKAITFASTRYWRYMELLWIFSWRVW